MPAVLSAAEGLCAVTSSRDGGHMGTQLTPARVRRHFDAHAGEYDRQFGAAEQRLLGEQRRWATSRARGRVLELAVGTGLNLPLYPREVRHVLGVDLSEE